MRRILNSIIICTLLLSCSQDILDPVQEETPIQETAVSGVAIIKFDDALLAEIENDLMESRVVTKSSEFNELQQLLGVVSLKRMFPYADKYEERTRAEGLHKWYIVNYDSDLTYTKASDGFMDFKGIEIVEPMLPVVMSDSFNDSWLNQQWHYFNDGSLSSDHFMGADINVLPVWERYTTGNEDVIVAVIDGGIDQNHEDLAANCIGGYNFVNGNSVLTPHDHGTHVAGTIGAVNNNKKGVAGIAGGNHALGNKGVSLLSCQIFQHAGGEKDESVNGAPAIKWAADHGAVIAQNSWGFVYNSYREAKSEIPQYLKEAIDYFIKYAGVDENGNQTGPMKGGVVIFSAGNSGWDADPIGAYSPVISVGAIGPNGKKAKYSNYGDWVDISAPGGDARFLNGLVYSTLPDNQYGGFQGTSMACPHVSGVAALLVSYYGGLGFTAENLKERLIGGANPTFPDSNIIGPLVDAIGSMVFGNNIAPDPVKDLNAIYKNGSLHFEWTVTADQDEIKADGYRVFISKSMTDLQGGVSSIPPGVECIDVKTSPHNLGDVLSVDFSKVQMGKTYYVSIIAYDRNNNMSPMSEPLIIQIPENGSPVIKPLQDISEIIKVGAHESVECMFEISDPDNHRCKVSVRNAISIGDLNQNDDGVYSFTISGNANLKGEYEAVLSVSDEFGAVSEYMIHYELLANMSPYLNYCVEDSVLCSLGESIKINLSDCFVDPDAGELQYEFYFSDPSVMIMSQEGDNVLISAMNYGVTEVVMAASDSYGASVEMRFKVAVRNGTEVLTYPNPVVDFLNISVPKSTSANIKIISQSGNVEYDRSLSIDPFKNIKIDMREFPSGMYHLAINGDGVCIEKQILKR